MILFKANGRCASAVSDEKITSGSAGIQVSFKLSEVYDDLAALAVFRGSGAEVSVILPEPVCTVPPEVLAEPGGNLLIGVYARDGDGTIAVPTVWAEAGRILGGATPDLPDTPATPDWTAQVELALAKAVARSEEALEKASEVEEEGARQVAAVQEAGTEATEAVGSAQTAAVQAVQTESTAQQAAVQAKGEEVLASIPEDYTTLAANVTLIAAEKAPVDITAAPIINCAVSASNTLMRIASKYRSYQMPRNALWQMVEITANDNYDAVLTFVKEALPTTPTSGQDMSSFLATGETGRHLIAKSQTGSFPIPSDCAYLVITYVSSNNNATPSAVVAATKIGADLDALADAVAGKLDSTYDVPLDWATVFGVTADPYGWQVGYFNSSGATGASDNYMRTHSTKYYAAQRGDVQLVFSVPSGYHAVIVAYDENGENGTAFGGRDSGEPEIAVALTEGHRYKFCIGKWSGNAEEYISEQFLSTVTATVKRSILEWQRVQDERIDALETDEVIPDYYFENDWLQGRLDAITAVQNTISENQDAFWLISDYHHQYNVGNSIPLLKYLAARTGINKLFFAGDAGGAAGTSTAARYHRLQLSTLAWEDMASCTDYFFGVLGNHEWISAETISQAGVMGSYLNRYKLSFEVDAATGNYIVSNNANKVRYYFIQNTSAAYPVNGSMDWLYKELMTLPDGWSAAVVMHFGWIAPAFQEQEYDGVSFSYNHLNIKGVSQLLQACRDHSAFVFSGTTYDFSGRSGTAHILGVFSGHTHHGILFPIGDALNTLGVMEFTASTDSMHAATVSVDGKPWYWEDGTVGGTKVVRERGTVTEQCFYAVQIDLDAKKLYITAVGGDHDYEAVYEA